MHKDVTYFQIWVTLCTLSQAEEGNPQSSVSEKKVVGVVLG